MAISLGLERNNWKIHDIILYRTVVKYEMNEFGLVNIPGSMRLAILLGYGHPSD